MFEKIEQWKEEYVIVKRIFLDFKDYPNLKISFPIGFFLILMAIALPIAIFFINKKKNDITLLSKQLIRHGAVDEDNAKTLKELRLHTVPSIRRALIRGGGQIASLVTFVGFQKMSYQSYNDLPKEEKKKFNFNRPDLEHSKFYVKEGKLDYVKNISSLDIASILKPIIISAICVAVLAIIFFTMPNILEALDSSFA